MKPNTRSKYFWYSLISALIFFIHLGLTGQLLKDAINTDHSYSLILAIGWAGVVWISVAALFYFKSTASKQTLLRQIAVSFLAPIVLSPIIAVVYVTLPLSPIYNLVNQSDFGN